MQLLSHRGLQQELVSSFFGLKEGKRAIYEEA